MRIYKPPCRKNESLTRTRYERILQRQIIKILKNFPLRATILKTGEGFQNEQWCVRRCPDLSGKNRNLFDVIRWISIGLAEDGVSRSCEALTDTFNYITMVYGNLRRGIVRNKIGALSNSGIDLSYIKDQTNRSVGGGGRANVRIITQRIETWNFDCFYRFSELLGKWYKKVQSHNKSIWLPG